MNLGKLRAPLAQLGKSLFVEGADVVSQLALKGAKVSLEIGNRCSKAALKEIENGAVPVKESSRKLGETFEEIGSEIATQIRNSKFKKMAVTTIEEGKDFAKTAKKVGKEIKTELKQTNQVFAQRMKVSSEELKVVKEELVTKARVLGSKLQEAVVSGKNKLCTPENFEKAKKASQGSIVLGILGGLAAFSLKTAQDIKDVFPKKEDKEIKEDLVSRVKPKEVPAKEFKPQSDISVCNNQAPKTEESTPLVETVKEGTTEHEKPLAEAPGAGENAGLAEAIATTKEGNKSAIVEGVLKGALATAVIGLGFFLLRK